MLPVADLAVILAIDWLLDRIRTTVNLLSDGFGCLVVDHMLQRSKWREGAGALAPAPPGFADGAVEESELLRGVRSGSGAGLVGFEQALEEGGGRVGRGQQVEGGRSGSEGLGSRQGPGYVQLQAVGRPPSRGY